MGWLVNLVMSAMLYGNPSDKMLNSAVPDAEVYYAVNRTILVKEDRNNNSIPEKYTVYSVIKQGRDGMVTVPSAILYDNNEDGRIDVTIWNSPKELDIEVINRILGITQYKNT